MVTYVLGRLLWLPMCYGDCYGYLCVSETAMVTYVLGRLLWLAMY
jgi:hypothetical protein